MESLTNKVIDGLEFAKTSLEKKDDNLRNREPYFAAKKDSTDQK